MSLEGFPDLIIAEHDGVFPAKAEWFERREVSEGGVESESAVFFEGGHGEDGIGVTGEDAGAGDAVDGIFGGLVTFGEMGSKTDGDVGFEGDTFEVVHETGHILGGILLEIAVGFVNWVQD